MPLLWPSETDKRHFKKHFSKFQPKKKGKEKKEKIRGKEVKWKKKKTLVAPDKFFGASVTKLVTVWSPVCST